MKKMTASKFNNVEKHTGQNIHNNGYSGKAELNAPM